MIILQLTTPELLAALFALAVLIFAAVIASYCLGAGSVNIDLEVKRRVKSPNIVFTGYQPKRNFSGPTPLRFTPPKRL